MPHDTTPTEDTIEFFCEDISVCFIEGNRMVDCISCPAGYVPEKLEIEYNGLLVFKKENDRVLLDLTDRCPRLPDLSSLSLDGNPEILVF
ncbi:hypothetical protein [Gloeobacter morelensis]|uniref:hypothetical protein n=1 Tax=Gloeobacter morelensis TaxID=2907343 RepID=UPI001E31033C|nr:hypothetical protein [Gloeobacter morelensis]UFP97134.1 hypothetical protein ISF26_23725 [Gloeobacter morelensis MG652769]